ncbi:hypothetical protein GLOTRDRAFT_128309 [Gloeophyllum trabeum ATCC 11539]|uniref:DUF6532 domain-containing protein n=1 Tax=Gloeophyllum trabeum (strain ATCC 11539 / FP-39264 / Madison 617) TaxID=670483 RepID=S7RPA4_GLOTA|nr:uncharacterized protein GLOTRDRAFT_128309 [Gloeophyllum trabeum ATCC 11539]EPQ56365.1 hypothetical protein GLOTRDRAFT_128309 [Gloeophyllum trabeum ATCC 11539]
MGLLSLKLLGALKKRLFLSNSWRKRTTLSWIRIKVLQIRKNVEDILDLEEEDQPRPSIGKKRTVAVLDDKEDALADTLAFGGPGDGDRNRMGEKEDSDGDSNDEDKDEEAEEEPTKGPHLGASSAQSYDEDMPISHPGIIGVIRCQWFTGPKCFALKYLDALKELSPPMWALAMTSVVQALNSWKDGKLIPSKFSEDNVKELYIKALSWVKHWKKNTPTWYSDHVEGTLADICEKMQIIMIPSTNFDHTSEVISRLEEKAKAKQAVCGVKDGA